VRSFAELLVARNRGRLDREAEEFLDFIQGGITHMGSLLRDLGEYTQLGHPDEPRHGIVSLTHVARTAAASCEEPIKQANAILTIEDLPIVRGNGSQLGQVFYHLIANAVKFRSPEQPAVRISAEDSGQFHAIAVRDNGIGIAPEHQERIFKIFERLHGDPPGGTGIGLALCRKIVARHGGRLWVESEAGAGSTFYFTLPMLRT
jgi:chemotaxis family two-component system sensor kinase Cph1